LPLLLHGHPAGRHTLPELYVGAEGGLRGDRTQLRSYGAATSGFHEVRYLCYNKDVCFAAFAVILLSVLGVLLRACQTCSGWLNCDTQD
jgi:hypothetical protein